MLKYNYCPLCMEKMEENGTVCPVCGQDIRIENDAHQLPVGTVLGGRYFIGRLLGEGGFGLTYIGRDLRLDMKVAVKEYYPSMIANRHHTESLDISVSQGEKAETFEQGKEKFLEEARILARFSNEPSIVQVKDFFTENNTAYLVMEFLEGQNLRQYVAEHGKMSFDTAFELLEPVMTSLEKVHGQGLIHRDISPSNLMLTNTGKVKLIDFGTARGVNYAGENSLSVILKPGYAPAEQHWSHGEQGPWSDVYALCATIYKLITGVTPDNALDRLRDDVLKKPKDLGAVITSVQESVLMKGLAVKWEDRISSVSELRQAFHMAESSVANVADEEKTLYKPMEESNGSEGFSESEHPGEDNSKAQYFAKEIVDKKTVADIKDQQYHEDQKSLPARSRRKRGSEEKQEKKAEKPKKSKNSKKKSLLWLFPAIVILVVVVWIFSGAEVSPYKNGNGAYVSNVTIDSKTIRQIAKDSDIYYLHLSGCEISDEMIAEIADMKYITNINLDECTGFTTLDPLAEMANLEILQYDGYSRDTDRLDGSIMFSVEFPQVEQLLLDDWQFTSGISFLENFPSVKFLTLFRDSGIDDGAVFSNLTNLVSLRISDSDIGDIDLSGISNCTKLDKIEAENCGLTSISWLEGLEALERLYINDNQIESLEPLRNLVNLYSLQVNNNQIESLEPLADITGLHTLTADNNMISSLTGLENLSELRDLELEGNLVTDISVLKGCTNLSWLDLDYNQISDISPLYACENIGYLYLDGNQVTNLDACERMVYLKYISAMNNQIEDISGLVNATQLKTVRLSGNQISDISVLAKSSQYLETVLLANNQIEDISALQGSENLYILTIENNKINSLDALSDSETLYYLSAHGNQISDISGLINCTNLYYIDLGENEITDITPIAETAVTSRVLLLQNNQISDISVLSTECSYEGLSLYNNPIADFSVIEQMPGKVFYASWDSEMDYALIAASSFGRYNNINLVEVPLDQQAELTNIHKEYTSGSPNFLTQEEADADINAFREELGEKNKVNEDAENVEAEPEEDEQ